MSAYSIAEKILQVQGVSLRLGGRPILQGLEIDIHNITRPGIQQGQVVALLGPSGVGKTQFFRLLAGLSTPDTGDILVGSDMKPIKAGMVGVVSQHYTLFQHRRVLGNLLVVGKQRGLTGEQALTRARDLLQKFGIADKEAAYPAQLSGGQRQRVAIIQQMMCSSHFLLMDEPFSGLDPISKEQACQLILSLSQVDELNTSIITTHDIETAVAVADTVWVMGRDRDISGTSLGARIQKKYDLAAMGLAWQTDIRNRNEYHEVVKQIRADFQSL